TEAQIAQWQSAYMAPEVQTPPVATGPGGFGPVGPVPAGPAPIGPGVPLAANLPTPAGPQLPNQQQKHAGPSYPHAAQQTAPNGKTVVREGGGQKWTDPTLLEWDPSHFRLFVGNLAGEVTDDSLFKAFSRYASVSKARVIRDKRTEKSKGYGFVSFADGDDYFKAAREMQGKYIGSHPVLLKKAVTEIKAVSANAVNRGGKKKGGAGAGEAVSPAATVTGAAGGVKEGTAGEKRKREKDHGSSKKHPKTRGGLKLLG
ncbi:hypothetical protein KEM55_004488, partial [Ascosphaera atra]